MKVKLFTDSDLDGLGCAIVAKLAYGDDVEVTHCNYRNLNQRVEDFLKKEDNHQVELFITDLAVNSQVEKMLEQRFSHGHHVQVIDHHVTAMHFNNYPWGYILAEYESGKKTSATSLYYDYLLEKKILTATPALDEFVDLVRQYDTWEWDANDNVLAKHLNDLFFMFGREQFEEDLIRRIKENKESFELTDMESMLMDVEEKKIERYIYSKNKQIIQHFVGDLCVGIVYAEQYLSELGNALNKKNPHLDAIVLVNVGSRKVGFRTIHEEVNVAKFAKGFGGGGHPKASGCDLNEETFRLFITDVFSHEPIKPDPEKNEYNTKDADHGTYYENRKGEISFIKKLADGQYEVYHQGKLLEEKHASFEEAERFVKRNFASWLQFDRDMKKKH
ncbi:DHHA1 domain-containing protein [Caldibacillus lycopersici]|uniref:DHHA1 domain-containing protein n=1 Tax=Perspicuibacillus lycopersici TaxID=1325689 RepID=A0AAE3LRC2_9BACI|nr:DHHA1 domain-containing protein [Perspicuibacillus lycopersici]MCU9614469.1 DHHA1 domain-containing protein [Perspicuibacillus lycopersici]